MANVGGMSHTPEAVSFCTFGMFIIDEIEWRTPYPPPTQYNLIGGAGTYAALGARLAVSPSITLAKSVSWIVDVGTDFPDDLKATIEKWNTNCVFREDLNRLTTRAWNGYGSNGWRDFKYLTEKRRLEVASLNVNQVMSKSFHMVCSPARCMELVQTLQRKREEIHAGSDWPVIVWEPIPDLCSPEELERLHMAAKNCSVVSPNHDELKLFFPDADGLDQADLVQRLMGWDKKCHAVSAPSFVTPIIREGSNGSTVYFQVSPLKKASSSNLTAHVSQEKSIVSIHLSAYHDKSMANQVTDPTGGGNTYLGALAVSMTDVHAQSTHENLHIIYKALGWSEEDKHLGVDHLRHSFGSGSTVYYRIRAVLVAMIFANIAASFAIEQNGVPELVNLDSNGYENETWNDNTIRTRLDAYLNREADSIREQLNHIKSLLEHEP